MKSNRMRTCWLLLLALMLGCSFLLSVNLTQARYTSTAVWNTVVSYAPGTVRSNCLSQEKQIILLGELVDPESEIQFTLEAQQAALGQLQWSCDAETYLLVQMQTVQNGVATDVSQGDVIELKPDAETTVVMTLTLTPDAVDVPHEETEIEVVVTYGDLSGTFCMTLPAVVEETTIPTEPEETTVPTEPEETTDSSEPEDTTDSSEPEETTDSSEPEDTTGSSEPEDTTGSSEPEDTTGSSEPEDTTGSSEPEDTTASSAPEGTTGATDTGATTGSTDTGESEEAAIQPEEPIPAETEETEAADTTQMAVSRDETTLYGSAEEENAAPSEEGDGDPEISETQPEGIQSRGTVTESQGGELPGQGTDTVVQLGIHTINGFDPAALLPVSIDIPADVQKIVLGTAGKQEDEQLQLEAFPPFTRYRLDDVCYLLYYGGQIELNVRGGETVTVMLELAETPIAAGEELVLGVEAYQDDAVLDWAAASTYAKVDFSQMETAQYLTAWFHPGMQTLDNGESSEVRSFAIALPEEWIEGDLDMDYSVERLCSDEAGTVYREVDLDESPLLVEYVREAQTHTLTVSIDEELPPAGTYRLCMRFFYQDVCFKEVQTLFWIHYT